MNHHTLLAELKTLPRTPGGFINISTVKTTLDHSPRLLDAYLMDLQKANLIVLNPYDDPARVTPEIAKHALRVPGGVRHYLYIK